MAQIITDAFSAIHRDDVSTLAALLDRAPTLANARNPHGLTPLILAARLPRAQQCLLHMCTSLPDLDPDEGDQNGEAALYHAAAVGNVRAVETLVSVAGASVDRENTEKITPLVIAAYNGHAYVCELLIVMGRAMVNHRDVTGKTALALAAYEGHEDVVKVLLRYGAEMDGLDQYGWTALMLAAFAGRAQVCRILLRAGADATIKTANGKTAMRLARDSGYPDVVELFSVDPESLSLVVQDSKGRRTLRPRSPVARNILPALDERVGGGYRAGEDGDDEDEDDWSTAAPLARGASTIPLTASVPMSDKPRQDTRPKARFMQQSAGDSEKQLLDVNHAKRPLNLPTDEPDRWSLWPSFARVLTFPLSACCLSFCGMRDRDVQQAWREKIALCALIALVSIVLGFLTFGFSALTCRRIPPIFPGEVLQRHGTNAPVSQRLMIVRGQLFRAGEYFQYGFHRPIAPIEDQDLEPIISPLYGRDISAFFPPNPAGSECKRWPAAVLNNTCDLSARFGGVDNRLLHCHRSVQAITALRSLGFSYVAFSWANVTDTRRKLFVYNDMVYDVTDYLSGANEQYLGDATMTRTLTSLIGRDASREFSMNSQLRALLPCFEEQFFVGKLNGDPVGCVASNLLVIISLVILLGITLIKFSSALIFNVIFSWKLGKALVKGKLIDLPHIIFLVTCYSENEDGIRTTFDSLAATDYSPSHKILFVVADGQVTGAGNKRSTPQICLDLMDRDPSCEEEVEPKSYIAVGDGPLRHNMVQVYIGTYTGRTTGRVIPYILLIKCGSPEERAQGASGKPGNRGKRDSQLVLMNWLSKVLFNERLTPLEFDMFQKLRRLTGVTPDRYELVLMVDADTAVKPDSVDYMVSAMQRDPRVMGLCGETKIVNKAESYVTMIQVYEYYISHHLGKAFESIFGGVTCLPGCFSMYRVWVRKPTFEGDNYVVPILASPDVVQLYSSNDVSTLHKKNLLLLGEDRYLTTLMLRAFPRRKMIFVPRAVCRTVAPSDFRVLLSQRRRWINSTIHNLFELVLVPQLCGIFCCSMHFVIVLELIGTAVMPFSLLYLIFLAISLALGSDTLLPLVFTLGMFLFQAVLVLFTTRRIIYVFWMLIYLLALPIWQFILPLYAFWHFDDFSWGATRKIDGAMDGHGSGDSKRDRLVIDLSAIPMKRWEQWIEEEREKTTRSNQLRKLQDKYQQQSPGSGAPGERLASMTRHRQATGATLMEPGSSEWRISTMQRHVLAQPKHASYTPSRPSSGYKG